MLEDTAQEINLAYNLHGRQTAALYSFQTSLQQAVAWAIYKR